MRSFCIVTNKSKDPDLKFTNKVLGSLKERGCSVTCDISGNYECLIVLGGDGTIIEAARNVKSEDIVLVGINIGHLGFLSSTEWAELSSALDNLANDNFTVEERMMIEARVESDGIMNNSVYVALNDVVINRMGYSRMISAGVLINDSLVDTYFGDGVIVSTPTGSTGYNLSAGGPIVTPEAELMVISPICPHSLSMRSVVVAANDRITIQLDMSRDPEPDNAILAIDGQQPIELFHGDRVYIRRADRKVRLVRFKDKNFFELLNMKLGEHKR